jgi:putative salt-induced outer membrane protein YdiY
MMHPGIFDLWTVNGSINIAGTKGNAETSTLTTPFSFIRASNTSRTSAYFNSIRSTATVSGVNAQTAKAIRGGWAWDHNITKKVFFNAFNDYEYDKFQSLDLRVVIGGGLGYKLWTGEKFTLSAVAGADWNREAFSSTPTVPALTRSSAEAFWGDDFSDKMNARTTITQSFRMFNNLSNTGQYRINFDAVATTRLTKWLTWNIGLSDRYLSDPVLGHKKNDFLYTTGFGFSFAR